MGCFNTFYHDRFDFIPNRSRWATKSWWVKIFYMAGVNCSLISVRLHTRWGTERHQCETKWLISAMPDYKPEPWSTRHLVRAYQSPTASSNAWGQPYETVQYIPNFRPSPDNRPHCHAKFPSNIVGQYSGNFQDVRQCCKAAFMDGM